MSNDGYPLGADCDVDALVECWDIQAVRRIKELRHAAEGYCIPLRFMAGSEQ